MAGIARVVIVPRWGAGPDDDWYAWLARKLAPRAEVEFVPLLPLAWGPRIDDCVDALDRAVGDAGERTVLVGHSVGCQVILRWLARCPPGSAAGVVCVAGWLELDYRAALEQEFQGLGDWLDTPIDHAAASAAVRNDIRLLLSDDDPYFADWIRARTLWRERAGARWQLVKGAGHFNEVHQRDVLGAVIGALKAVGGSRRV